jgi:deoxycytidylate deaminase
MECNALVFVRSPWMISFRYSASHLKKINHVYMCHTIQNRHEYFMRQALELAKESFCQGEVPIGAVLVNSNGDIIAKGRNQVERSKDATQHAEMQCIQSKYGYTYCFSKHFESIRCIFSRFQGLWKLETS